MGCLLSSEREAPLSTAVHVEIEAPTDWVWDIITDIQSLPKIISCIDHVAFPGQGGDQHRKGADTKQPVLEVGMQWIETRKFICDDNDSKPERQVKTIVKLEADGHTRALGVNIGFLRKDGRGHEDAITNTCTFTVQTVNDMSCVLICSVAFHAVGMNCIPRCCLERLVLKYANEHLLREVEDYRKAAEETFKKTTVNDPANDQ